MDVSPLQPSRLIGPAHLAKIKTHLANVQDALHESVLAQRAGVGDADMHKNLEDMRDRLIKIKSVYFPGQ
jgi:hypothetical protein